jgi:hypothetical protein
LVLPCRLRGFHQCENFPPGPDRDLEPSRRCRRARREMRNPAGIVDDLAKYGILFNHCFSHREDGYLSRLKARQ